MSDSCPKGGVHVMGVDIIGHTGWQNNERCTKCGFVQPKLLVSSFSFGDEPVSGQFDDPVEAAKGTQ
jgi:hypothetical protein